MTQTINTNIASLNAQRNLDRSQGALQTSLQRLSSGLRINSAKDDAAGLAISDRFTTQINGLGQAVRNANDGISLSQTGEGALAEVTNNLQRIRELAVQASNATNSASDRAAINLEVQQRLAEIDRTASQTSFNGQKILDGSFGSATFQVGANAGETITLGLSGSVRNADIGKIATTTSAALSTSGTGGSITATNSTLNFGTAAAAQVDGSFSVAPSSLSFGTAGSAQVDATSTATPTSFDFSTTAASFSVGGHGITLNANYTDADGVAAELQTQLQTFDSNYSVTNSAGTLTITLAGSTLATDVAISGADAGAIAAGITDTAGTAGTAAVATTNASFTADGHSVTLNQDYADADALAADIGTQMGAGYSVTNTSGTIKITHTGSIAAVNITVADANATTAGFTGSGTAGSAAVATTNASFNVDGHAVTLNANYADEAALASAIQGQLTGYTVTSSGSTLTITNSTTGSAAVAITGADANATAAGFGNATGTAGTAGGAVTLASGAFTLKVGANTAVDLSGTYSSTQGLADAINSKVSGLYATVTSSGALKLSSAEDITVGGTAPPTGLTAGTVQANGGKLSDVNTLTVANANEALQRIDSALKSVDDLRGTFGAIQNRFDSVISSLSAARENLSASRSRIQDADFAAETASLTRGQILQQAGIAMLSQANQLPQAVLALLR